MLFSAVRLRPRGSVSTSISSMLQDIYALEYRIFQLTHSVIAQLVNHNIRRDEQAMYSILSLCRLCSVYIWQCRCG